MKKLVFRLHISDIIMLDLDKALITCSFDASNKLLKIWLTLIRDSIKFEIIRILMFL